MLDLSQINELIYLIAHVEGSKITICEDKYSCEIFPADYTRDDVERLKDNPCNCELGFVLVPYYIFDVGNDEEFAQHIVEI